MTNSRRMMLTVGAAMCIAGLSSDSRSEEVRQIRAASVPERPRLIRFPLPVGPEPKCIPRDDGKAISKADEKRKRKAAKRLALEAEAIARGK